ncbi:BglG family transcription antiterminator [Allofustis seminis]|uniref:BglG family transcription antiterminator n=1 Tax=Allofustis seminis TaxID=166939 RepID=UPI0003631A48|nr:PTS sugar transporter subunit IIA [Allofustis seminis]
MKSRSIEILRRLLEDLPVDSKSLAQEFRVSQRTIRNDIQEINDYLEQLGVLEIQNSKEQGYILQLSQEQQHAVVKNLYAFNEYYLNRKERIFDLLLTLSFSSKKIFVNQMEEKYQVSKSTMDQDMRQLRKLIEAYDIQAVSLPREGMKLIGSEQSIRIMLFDYINETVGVIDFTNELKMEISPLKRLLTKYITPFEMQKVKDIIAHYICEIDEDIYQKQIALFMLVWLKRLRVGEYIDTVTSEKNHGQQNIAHCIQQVAETFQLSVPESERAYIQFIISSFNMRELDNPFEWTKIQFLTMQLIQHVEAQTHIPFTASGRDLFTGLYQHMAAFTNRVAHDIQIKNPLTEEIKKDYGKIFRSIQSFMVEEIDSSFNRVTDDEIAFLTIHFSSVAIKINKLLQPSYKCVVVCSHGLATGNLLAVNLKSSFPQLDIVAVLGAGDLEIVDKLDVDLIFTTSPLSSITLPTLELSPILNKHTKEEVKQFLHANQGLMRIVSTEQKYTQFFNQILSLIEKSAGNVSPEIYHELKNLFQKNHLRVDMKEILPMLKDVLTDRHIFIHEPCEDWRQAIELVAQPLLKQRNINPEYITAMIETLEEHGPYIVIGKNLALAHARPEDGVNHLGLSVATFKEGVTFHHPTFDPVKIVFCLAATDSYSHLNVMRELVELINDEKKVEALIEADDLHTFKNILFDQSAPMIH